MQLFAFLRNSKYMNRRNFVNGILFSIFSFLTNGMNFFLLFVLASYLKVSDFGQLNLYTVFITILMIIISLNSTAYIQVAYFKMQLEAFYTRIVGILLISSISLLIVVSILCLLNLMGINTEIIIGFPLSIQIVAVAICYFQIFYNIVLELYRIEEKIYLYGIFSLSFMFFNFILSLFFIVCLGIGWRGRVYAQLLVTFIAFVVSFILLYKRLGHAKRELMVTKEIFSFSLPLIPHNVSSWIRQGGDRYILNSFYTTTVVGYFSFAFSCSNIIHVIGIAFNATNSVFLYKNLSSDIDCRAILKRQTIQMIGVYFFITVLSILFVYALIPIFFTQYNKSMPFIIPLCFASFFQCVYYLFVNYLFFFKRTKRLMYITFFFSLLHFSLSYTLLRYSLYWVSYINLFSNFFITLLVFSYSQKLYPLFHLKKDSKNEC